MNSGRGDLTGSCLLFARLPNFFGFRPSSRAISICSSERWKRLCASIHGWYFEESFFFFAMINCPGHAQPDVSRRHRGTAVPCSSAGYYCEYSCKVLAKVQKDAPPALFDMDLVVSDGFCAVVDCDRGHRDYLIVLMFNRMEYMRLLHKYNY